MQVVFISISKVVSLRQTKFQHIIEKKLKCLGKVCTLLNQALYRFEILLLGKYVFTIK